MAQHSFSALIVDKQDDGTQSTATFTTLNNVDALPNQADGELLIRVTHSCLNYKDALAVTGKGKVLRAFPIVPGIDLAGVVAEADPNNVFQVGDEVLVTGYGVGETVAGGYAEFCRVKTDWVLPIPTGLSRKDCMAIGTAGFTAMLSVLALESHGVSSEQGPVLVTGAAGGVGSIAILVLEKLGYEVVASSGRVEEQGDYLRHLGATELIHRKELATPSSKPLESERWAGAVDTVGGETLASILRQTKYRGSVTACGLVGGANLPSTVFPFILRGVNLLGIDSVMCPQALREKAWQRLATDLELEKLRGLQNVIALQDVLKTSEEMFLGKIRGRVVVDLGL
ncbi:quinone oxidoreductase, YhdH/YhfP family [[Leptolyngbya] sp. PCC 7376]|uniref:MDR family oxidoreductase n=1 Tax=[Leptolyngbya] sp. PCC 7376 TaxID=111781 RepID=UPI00029F4BB5|nr:MDR family oxidoreductase [[Leptolyngbya] sp. PCC 7376]AFY36660.1 quinone oxidoreductase, YhdH/YhfP family [[Leptolyngbya] sp. PCC 7376]